MNNQEKTMEFIKTQCLIYPKLRPQDLLKALHQSTFGCGHFVSDAAKTFLYDEFSNLNAISGPDMEMLDGDFVRLHLRYLTKHRLSPETLFRLFVMSSKMPAADIAVLRKKLDLLLKLALDNELPFSYDEIKTAIDNWQNQDFCACHHSPSFKEAYFPTYRVIHKSFVKWLPFLSEIDLKCSSSDRVLVAIEGGSASGKSTLSKFLSEIYDCNVFHMDDFFLQPEQKTKNRLSEPGGNIDWERFEKEVLIPLSNDECISYRRFDCSTQEICEPVIFSPKKLNIIEGAYSMHPALSKYYDLSIFLEIQRDLQKERILIRNSKDIQDRFFLTWIPMEEKYFKTFDIINHCNLVLEVDK